MKLHPLIEKSDSQLGIFLNFFPSLPSFCVLGERKCEHKGEREVIGLCNRDRSLLCLVCLFCTVVVL